MIKFKSISSLSVLLLSSITLFAQQSNYKFKFGSGKVPAGYVLVSEKSTFKPEKGYGFEPGTPVNVALSGGKDLIKQSTITAGQPFYFSVNVPEGNYKVTLTLGDAKVKTATTVKAEARRLMLENITTKPGEFVTKTFIVNVRNPEISTGAMVKLNDRELNSRSWDKKLTLEFNGAKPSVAALELTKVEDQVTVYLAGNSTVVDQRAEPWASWGQMIPRFFEPGVAFANYAESGLTLASFKGQKRLEKILTLIKPGDYLFIEFGHNDQKMKGENDGAWKSYTDNFKYYIAEAKKKGGIPVIVTSTSRRRFDENGKTINTLGDFPAAAKKVAADEKVELIDLNAMTAVLYDALGVEPSKKAFVFYPANTYPGQDKELADNTHFNSYGAYELAKCVALGIQQSNLGIKKFLVPGFSFNPSKPDAVTDFAVPPSLDMDLVKPAGN
ncbi:rhamnogalacturonan acetylesterase [Pedobacter sp. BMA]|uniref:rhamnogalacturonan acetylesterase n=1 Tax=Pedobacter sp. BMA TaxID=1663685 RepID=UPI00064A9B64|nr:rhamnogalacturonan acetylesterase [Pedobacter sp. BMA]KLT67411.1 rhamnogalacturonan acetylesterase [Pedobacter sp. BMA]